MTTLEQTGLFDKDELENLKKFELPIAVTDTSEDYDPFDADYLNGLDLDEDEDGVLDLEPLYVQDEANVGEVVFI